MHKKTPKVEKPSETKVDLTGLTIGSAVNRPTAGRNWAEMAFSKSLETNPDNRTVYVGWFLGILQKGIKHRRDYSARYDWGHGSSCYMFWSEMDSAWMLGNASGKKETTVMNPHRQLKSFSDLPRALQPSRKSAIATVCKNLEEGVDRKPKWNWNVNSLRWGKAESHDNVKQEMVVTVSKQSGRKLIYVS
jgi:hypothetical protein